MGLVRRMAGAAWDFAGRVDDARGRVAALLLVSGFVTAGGVVLLRVFGPLGAVVIVVGLVGMALGGSLWFRARKAHPTATVKGRVDITPRAPVVQRGGWYLVAARVVNGYAEEREFTAEIVSIEGETVDDHWPAVWQQTKKRVARISGRGGAKSLKLFQMNLFRPEHHRFVLIPFDEDDRQYNAINCQGDRSLIVLKVTVDGSSTTAEFVVGVDGDNAPYFVARGSEPAPIQFDLVDPWTEYGVEPWQRDGVAFDGRSLVWLWVRNDGPEAHFSARFDLDISTAMRALPEELLQRSYADDAAWEKDSGSTVRIGHTGKARIALIWTFTNPFPCFWFLTPEKALYGQGFGIGWVLRPTEPVVKLAVTVVNETTHQSITRHLELPFDPSGKAGQLRFALQGDQT